MMMVGIIAAQAEQLLPIHAHGIRRSGIHQRVQLPIHCGEADAQSGIHQLAMQLLRGNEIITAAKLRHHGILLLRMPHRPVRHHTLLKYYHLTTINDNSAVHGDMRARRTYNETRGGRRSVTPLVPEPPKLPETT